MKFGEAADELHNPEGIELKKLNAIQVQRFQRCVTPFAIAPEFHSGLFTFNPFRDY